MTKEQAYFLELVKSHLNNTKPKAPKEIDFAELFKVCEIQNMTAIAAVKLRDLKDDGIISKEEFSPFNQVLGLTFQNYCYKQEGVELLKNVLCGNKIKHLFLKGAEVRYFYPTPELRTSGDIDIVVKKEDFEKAAMLLVENGFKVVLSSDIQYVLTYLGEEYELKNYLDCLNDKCEEYFSDVFESDKCEDEKDYNYSLFPFYHLIYIISHMLKHFKSGGAGVRQICDIDVILRNCQINLNELFRICEELDFGKSSKVLVSLAKRFFDTPIDFEYEIDIPLLETLEDVILNGGTFGYGIGDIGTTRLMKTINSSGSSGKVASFKSLIGLFIIDKENLYHNYKYAREHHFLLPVAYFSRLYSAVFKRGAQNIKHIQSMFSDREIASKMSDMLNELEINK